MSNFRLHFPTSWQPWLFLLLIPAIGFVLWSYFRLSKKYRRTRYRIISTILSIIVMCLSVSVLAGISFRYTTPNYENEIILLVDLSQSNSDKAAADDLEHRKNEFIRTVLDSSREQGSIFKMGIVTFGKDQVYAARLSYDVSAVYNDYLRAQRPDDSASNISAALVYASELFDKPETAKIVVISDGIETDGSALSGIVSVIGKKIKVDTVRLSDEVGDEIGIIGMTIPDYNIQKGENVKIGVTVHSTYAGMALITLYDNGVSNAPVSVPLSKGTGTYTIDHTFTEIGQHELCVKIEPEKDRTFFNNTYYSYLNLYVFDRILLVDGGNANDERVSTRFGEMLTDYDVTTADVKDVMTMLSSGGKSPLASLAEFEQVILVNVAHKDMPTGFEEVLYEYVGTLGGGLLTIGGDKAYDADDMNPLIDRVRVPTLYQQMLPVECVPYTPPLALMIVIDRSDSMNATDGTKKSRMELAKEGAIACVNSLTERDYVGIISFSGLGDTREDIKLTPVPQKAKILSAIGNIGTASSTFYSTAVQRAGQALQGIDFVERKHVMFITDGVPMDASPEDYLQFVRLYAEHGITLSVIQIAGGRSDQIETMAKEGKGEYHHVTDVGALPRLMQEELLMDEIKGPMSEPFTPRIKDITPEVNKLVSLQIPQMGGVYGTKPRANSEIPLRVKGYDTPIYAKWRFGEGRVGSFMCDLEASAWSADFMLSEFGVAFIDNMVRGVFPTVPIELKDIVVNYDYDNFTTRVRITTQLEAGESLIAIVTPLENLTPPADYQTPSVQTYSQIDSSSGFPRFEFTFSTPGVYQIEIRKEQNNGTEVSHYLTHMVFSYSSEYLFFLEDSVEGQLLLSSLAQRGKGKTVSFEQPNDILEGQTKALPQSKDPTIPFAIVAAILFLLDMMVRKFKFKWPWEIVRDYKAKKAVLGDRR